MTAIHSSLGEIRVVHISESFWHFQIPCVKWTTPFSSKMDWSILHLKWSIFHFLGKTDHFWNMDRHYYLDPCWAMVIGKQLCRCLMIVGGGKHVFGSFGPKNRWSVFQNVRWSIFQNSDIQPGNFNFQINMLKRCFSRFWTLTRRSERPLFSEFRKCEVLLK